MLVRKLSRAWILNQSLYPSILSLSTRSVSSDAKIPFISTKLNQSYYHHASNIPLLYHTVGQHLDKLADLYPTHECYVFKGEGNKRYTYKSLVDEVNSLATSLIELGFQKGDRIGVWLPNQSENCVLSYATSKAGLIKVSYFLTTNIDKSYENYSR